MAPLASPSTARGNSTACLRPALSNALILAATSSAVPLDQEGATVQCLAQRLGVGSRQLTRLFARYLQASPSKVARTARVQRAKRLIDESSLPMTEIAMRAGFTQSGVSNAIIRLEDRLGVRLVGGTTRRVHLTVDGRAFLDRCRRLVAGLEEA